MPASRYYLDGKRVPGCTSAVIEQLGWSKRSLMHWANKIGLEGKELSTYTRPADIGTFAHAAVEADLKGEELDLSDVPADMMKPVRKILERFQEWKASRIDKVLLAEEELVSREHVFGGRPDLVFRSADGKVWLLDLKTGGVYPEQLVQVAAYALLVEEQTEHRIDTLALLRIPQDSEGLTTFERPWDRDSPELRVVMLARELYDLHKVLKSEV